MNIKKISCSLLIMTIMASSMFGCHKVPNIDSESGALPAPDYLGTGEEEYNPDSIIPRTEVNLSETFKQVPLTATKYENYSGSVNGMIYPFARISNGTDSFDIQYAITQFGMLDVETNKDKLVITAKNGTYQFRIAKIADEATFKLTAGNDEATVALNNEYKAIKNKYNELFTVACYDNEEHTGENFYDDSVYGGLYTYSSMAEFRETNGLQKEYALFSEVQVREAIKTVFEIPDNYFYLSTANKSYRNFGSSGIFTNKNTNLDHGYIYFLLYGENGVYAVECYFATPYYTPTEVSQCIAVSHSDNDVFYTDADLKYTLLSHKNLTLEENDDPTQKMKMHGEEYDEDGDQASLEAEGWIFDVTSEEDTASPETTPPVESPTESTSTEESEDEGDTEKPSE